MASAQYRPRVEVRPGIRPPPEKPSSGHDFHRNLGVSQIVLGAPCIPLQVGAIIIKANLALVAHGIWGGLVLVAAGVVGILAAYNMKSYMIQATRLISVASACCGAVIGVLGCVTMVTTSCDLGKGSDCLYSMILHGCLVTMGILGCVTATVQAASAGRALSKGFDSGVQQVPLHRDTDQGIRMDTGRHPQVQQQYPQPVFMTSQVPHYAPINGHGNPAFVSHESVVLGDLTQPGYSRNAPTAPQYPQTMHTADVLADYTSSTMSTTNRRSHRRQSTGRKDSLRSERKSGNRTSVGYKGLDYELEGTRHLARPLSWTEHAPETSHEAEQPNSRYSINSVGSSEPAHSWRGISSDRDDDDYPGQISVITSNHSKTQQPVGSNASYRMEVRYVRHETSYNLDYIPEMDYHLPPSAPWKGPFRPEKESEL